MAGPPGAVLCVIRVVNGKAHCDTHDVDFVDDKEIFAHRQEKLEEWRAQQQVQEAMKVVLTDLDLEKIKDPVQLQMEVQKRVLQFMTQAQMEIRRAPKLQGHVEISFAWGDKLTVYITADSLAEMKARIEEIRNAFFEWTRVG